jgi:hypothetical protein
MPTVGKRRETRWALGITLVVIAVLVIAFPGRKVEEKPSGPAPDATALEWLCGALHTRSPHSAIEDFPGVSRAGIREASNAVHGWGRHDLTVRVGAWNLKASYDTDAFDGIWAYAYKIETEGNAGPKVFRSLDDARKWLGRFGAVREVPPTYSVTMLDGGGGMGDHIHDTVSATYTKTRQSLEFQFYSYGLVDSMKPLCMK